VAWSLLAKRELPPAARADRIVVEKQAHTLTLYRGASPLKTYSVALGRGGLGPKTEAGDNKVPEGTYRITGRNSQSEFHRSLRVGYPTPEQKRVDARAGVAPGGDIMVHGIRNGLGWLGPLHRAVDWTRGCVALTDGEMDEVWRAVPDGTPIEIKP
jgi:murein L,D-transpeptidase YafK